MCLYFRRSCVDHPGCAGTGVCRVPGDGDQIGGDWCDLAPAILQTYLFQLQIIFVQIAEYICLGAKIYLCELKIYLFKLVVICAIRARLAIVQTSPTSSTLQLLDEPAPGAGGTRWLTKFNIERIFSFISELPGLIK